MMQRNIDKSFAFCTKRPEKGSRQFHVDLLSLVFPVTMPPVKLWGQATESFNGLRINSHVNPFAGQCSLRIGSFPFIFFPRLSVSTWKTMVELQEYFDPFIMLISQTTAIFNFRAEKNYPFMVTKECRLSNSTYHQVLYHGDLNQFS